jgi:hypothetical protein
MDDLSIVQRSLA